MNARRTRGTVAGKKVLVTGAAGFVGVNVCRAFAAAGAEVVGVVRPPGSPQDGRWRLPALQEAARLLERDLRDFESLAASPELRTPEIVVHSAARSPYDREAPLRTFVADDLLGLANLLDALDGSSCRRVIFLGSSLAYGPSPEPHREADALRPTSRRGTLRAASSLLALQAGRERPWSTVELRLFSVYGPWEPPHRLIPRAIRAAASGAELPLTPPGLCRDPVYVEDVAAACLLAATTSEIDDKVGEVGEVINVGSGRQVANEEVVAAIERVTGRPITKRPGTYPRHGTDRERWVADVGRARRLLGWEPRHDLEEGLARTVDWHQRTRAWPD